MLWKNTNKLLWKDDGWIGVKTGTTESAGPCLMACRDQFLISVYNCDSLGKRFIECAKIYDKLKDWPLIFLYHNCCFSFSLSFFEYFIKFMWISWLFFIIISRCNHFFFPPFLPLSYCFTVNTGSSFTIWASYSTVRMG